MRASARTACLILAAALLGCAGSVPAERTEWERGRTPAGVSYLIPSFLAFDRASCVAQIDSDSVWDRRYTVRIMPGAWVDPRYGWVVGLCDPNTMIITVTHRPNGERLPLPALLHEFNHARLSNENGSTDPLHLDPSWRTYY